MTRYTQIYTNSYTKTSLNIEGLSIPHFSEGPSYIFAPYIPIQTTPPILFHQRPGMQKTDAYFYLSLKAGDLIDLRDPRLDLCYKIQNHTEDFYIVSAEGNNVKVRTIDEFFKTYGTTQGLIMSIPTELCFITTMKPRLYYEGNIEILVGSQVISVTVIIPKDSFEVATAEQTR